MGIKNIFTWKWLVLLFASIAISASLTACGNDNDDEYIDEPEEDCALTGMAKELIGDWFSEDDSQGYRFNADGTGWCGTNIQSPSDFEGGERFINFRVIPNEEINEYALEVLWDDEPDWYTMAYIGFSGDKNTIQIRNRM